VSLRRAECAGLGQTCACACVQARGEGLCAHGVHTPPPSVRWGEGARGMHVRVHACVRACGTAGQVAGGRVSIG